MPHGLVQGLHPLIPPNLATSFLSSLNIQASFWIHLSAPNQQNPSTPHPVSLPSHILQVFFTVSLMSLPDRPVLSSLPQIPESLPRFQALTRVHVLHSRPDLILFLLSCVQTVGPTRQALPVFCPNPLYLHQIQNSKEAHTSRSLWKTQRE